MNNDLKIYIIRKTGAEKDTRFLFIILTDNERFVNIMKSINIQNTVSKNIL